MGDLVQLKDGEAVTTSLAIAEGTANSHEAVIKLVRTYPTDLEQFGLVRFEIRPRSPGQHGGADVQYALLNEQQSALIIAYMRNSEIVRRFKVALIKGFYEMRTKLTASDPLAELPPEHRALVALMVDNAKIKARQEEIVATQTEQQDALSRIEANQSAAIASVRSFTALGYSIYREIPMSKIELTRLGKKAAALSKARGLTVDHVSDGRYGRVGSYHISVSDDALEEISK
ncbi:Rha family transcriptional regulator [Herbaspirillum sp. NPDC101396]|uniref:Rha family transcriptional regulator n=1 Tax=Herbaspirillum sp. NPDC101396 TaxID=3364005 RepID=UPI00383BCA39